MTYLNNTHLYYGPMFAGKTTKLLSLYKKGKTLIYRPHIDDREPKTHNGLDVHYKSVKSIKNIGEAFSSRFDTVLFDEIQFFSKDVVGFDIIEELRVLDSLNKPVYCAGLMFNWQGNFFPVTESVRNLLNPDNIKQLKADCSLCGRPATMTDKAVKDDKILSIGGKDSYRPLCYKCWCENNPVNL